jgi:hypothetical protein
MNMNTLLHDNMVTYMMTYGAIFVKIAQIIIIVL